MIMTYVLLLAVFPVLVVWLSIRNRRLPLPPGPGGSWRSNAKPGAQPWETYKDLAKIYGPIMCIQSFWSYAFVVDTAEALLELYEKRSVVYSCRPRWTMAELLGRQNNVGLMYYGERLKRARKVLHRGIGFQAMAHWEPLFDYQSLKMISDIMATPSELSRLVEHNVETMTVRFTYGSDMDDEYLRLAKVVNGHTALALQPGRWLVNYIPWLRYIPAWFPGAGFQKLGKEGKALYVKMTRPPYEQVKQAMAGGFAYPCFVSNLLTDMEKHPHLGIDEPSIMSAAGSVFSAAVDTTSTAITTFFLLMATHPDAQDRAYQEIRAVIGTQRLPELQDRDSLPYLNCLIKEIFRFNPPIPILTHSPNEDDTFNGCRIPKKSWVFGNVWSILHDEEKFHNPGSFIPERFMPTDDGSTLPDPRDFAFGLGRRVCPGIHFANALIFLTVARAIALLEIRPLEGETLPIEFSAGLVSRPKPFRCRVSRRSGTSNEVLVRLEPDVLKAQHNAMQQC